MARADTLPSTRAGGQIRIASAINVLLGIWLIIAAFTLAVSEEAYWNDLIVGIVVLILAATRLSRPTEGTKPASWVNAAIGVWLIAAPFILSYERDQEMWNDIIVGVLLLIFAGWSAALPRERDTLHGGMDTTARRDTTVPPTGTPRGDVDTTARPGGGRRR
ncbi:MAG TPA: SPW repeat protein [Gammaproteobacteria bacterium]